MSPRSVAPPTGAAGVLRVLTILTLLGATGLRAQIGPPPHLAGLADLDAFVSDSFASLTNDAVIYPTGAFRFGINCGMSTFADGSDLAALTNQFNVTTAFGVPVYRINVIETQGTTRVWLYMGTNDVAFHTNDAPASFNSEEWTRIAYRHDPPSYLTGTNLARWYADRDRARLFLMMTLVNSNDWPTLDAARSAAATNAPESGAQPPTLPPDTNRLAFAGIEGLGSDIRLWLYSPATRPVVVFTRSDLTGPVSGWTYAGNLGAVPTFNLWQTAADQSNAFFNAGFSDVDSDGDGIPDIVELLVTGTDPFTWDSAGTSLGDYARYFIYGLLPSGRDLNGDGMDDDESILAGLDPNAWNTGADAISIRYYYDADDRVAGAFSGSPAGAVVYKISPAGNHASTAERSVP